MIRTTIYINSINLSRLENATQILNISRNELISIFISRLTKESNFETKFLKAVKYQKSNPDIIWKTLHVRFEPIFYEKSLDLRRNYKYSVSHLIAYAIQNYLDDIIKKLKNPDNRKNTLDNYDRNYLYIDRIFGNIPAFIVTWGIPKEKYLKRLLR